MNKKLIVITGLLVVVIALGAVGIVAAQQPTPPAPPYGNGYGYGPGGMMGGGYGRGMMGNGYGRGMMGNGYGRGISGGFANDGAYGPMHDAMFNALAEGLGLSREELDKRVANGETPYQIALSLGFTQTEFYTLMTDARNVALDGAVANGTFTQEQADWMRNRMNGFDGNCPHLNQNTQPNS